jgi:hypothetical protein
MLLIALTSTQARTMLRKMAVQQYDKQESANVVSRRCKTLCPNIEPVYPQIFFSTLLLPCKAVSIDRLPNSHKILRGGTYSAWCRPLPSSSAAARWLTITNTNTYPTEFRVTANSVCLLTQPPERTRGCIGARTLCLRPDKVDLEHLSADDGRFFCAFLNGKSVGALQISRLGVKQAPRVLPLLSGEMTT